MIEEEKKKRIENIINIKKRRRRLEYKTVELETLSKLSTTIPKDVRIGKLRRIKENIEFKISTESHTLASEKELIRKLTDVDSELNEVIKIFKLKRKISLITGDIELLNKEISEFDKSIEENDKRLDVLYDEFRSLTRMANRSNNSQLKHKFRKQEFQEPEHMNISLEDIAVIKKKNNKKDKTEGN
jgi:uncharacterized coiled-coil DUF342 family protein